MVATLVDDDSSGTAREMAVSEDMANQRKKVELGASPKRLVLR